MSDMTAGVVRIWKGYGTADGLDRHRSEHFANTVLLQLRALDGFCGASVLVRGGDDETEVVVATVWQSLESVKAFAGAAYKQAVVEPVVRNLLDHVDDQVTISPLPCLPDPAVVCQRVARARPVRQRDLLDGRRHSCADLAERGPARMAQRRTR